MIRIYNGKKYDTSTASIIGYHESLYHKTDYHYYDETLYQKRTGEFFIYGKGNGNSLYHSVTKGGLRSQGEAIVPISRDVAKQWAAEYLTYEEYVHIFGDVEE